MESITRLRRIGGSLVVTVPKKLIDVERLSSGQLVRIIVAPAKKSFFGVARGIGSFTKGDKRWAEGRDD